MKTSLVIVSLAASAFALGAFGANGDKQGHGAGGVRAEHASEQGLDKGKAWAGSRATEAPVQLPENEAGEQGQKFMKQEKEKNQEKTQKQEKTKKQEKTGASKGK